VKILNGKFRLKNKKIDEFGNIFPTKETWTNGQGAY
jgi:hypothetical protein